MPTGYRHHRDYSPINGAKVSVFSDLLIGERRDSVSTQFQYNIATDEVTTSSTGSGSISQNGSQAVIATGTDNTASASMRTIRSIRYRPGHEGYAQFTAAFTGTDNKIGISNSNQLVGIFNDDEGYLIGFSGERFAVIRRKNGVDNITYREDFNLDKLDGSTNSQFDIDLRGLNVWRIRFGWLGASVIIFEVMKKNGEWIEFHRINFPGTTKETSINNPVLPFAFTVEKINGNTTDVNIRSGSLNGGFVGTIYRPSSRYKSYANIKESLSGGSVHNIFTLRSKETFHGKQSLIDSQILFISFGPVNAGSRVIYRLIKNGNLDGTPSYTDIDSVNSVLEVDTAGTIVSGGQQIITFSSDGSSPDYLDLKNYEVEILPGETLSFTAEPSANGSIRMATRWLERF